MTDACTGFFRILNAHALREREVKPCVELTCTLKPGHLGWHIHYADTYTVKWAREEATDFIPEEGTVAGGRD